MKKIVSILILLAILLSCCACGAEETNETQASTAATEAAVEVVTDKMLLDAETFYNSRPTYEEVLAYMEMEEKAKQADPEKLYGMIDQTVPVNGVYKIWNAEGVQLMAEHPDAHFELLCSIDMEGATVKTIGTKDKPFTGIIDGANAYIANFTVEATDDGYLGFLGYCEGEIKRIKLENVTFVAKENTKYMGGMAAYSTIDIKGCTVTGTMVVDQAAEDAVCGGFIGQTSGDVINSVADVDITYTAAGSATIGGLVGICEDGKVEFSETYGLLDITGSNKTTGLLMGQAKDLTLYTVSFLGENNLVDGTLFANYFGTDENVTYEVINVRDNTVKPLPEAQQKLRDRVVAEMYEMATIEWYTSENLYHDCACLLTICHGIFEEGKLHVGVPYNHKGNSMARFQYCLTEDNTVRDWVYPFVSYDGYDLYMGNDCSSAIQHAWWTVSNTTDLIRCTYMHPKFMEQNGCIPVGEWNWTVGIDEKGNKYTANYTKPYALASGTQTMYEAYAQMHMGDAYSMLSDKGGHTRMAVAEPVVVRDENGLINGKLSFVKSVEQGGPNVIEPYYCSWNVDKEYTFQQLFDGGYLPVTCEELLTGEMEPVEVTFEGGVDGKMGMVCGEIKSNYFLDGAQLVITDSQGNVVLDHVGFPTVDKYLIFSDSDSGIRNYNDTFKMGLFTSVLQNVEFEMGETYHYSVTVWLATDDRIEVKTGSFVQGEA